MPAAGLDLAGFWFDGGLLFVGDERCSVASGGARHALPLPYGHGSARASGSFSGQATAT